MQPMRIHGEPNPRARFKPSPIVGVTSLELPRERLFNEGPEALRDYELLAVVLGTGCKGQNVLELAKEMLSRYPKERLIHAEILELQGLKGVGATKSAVLVAAFELARRALQVGVGILPGVTTPHQVVPLLADIKDELREHFVCLYLNARHQVIEKQIISIGSLSASIVHPREVFQSAVLHSAASIIVAHNHPSGDVSPSADDIQLTKRLVKAAEIMGIDLLDHVIIASDDFLSFKDQGLL